MTDLFEILRRANYERCERSWCAVSDRSGEQWAKLLREEVDELAAEALALDRDGLSDAGRQRLAHEIADVQMYLDLLAARFGVALWPAVVEKYNIVSERRGSPLKLVLEGEVSHCTCQHCGSPEAEPYRLHGGVTEHCCLACGEFTETLDYRSRSGATPTLYRCAACDAHGVKLWRESTMVVDYQTLRCCECACRDHGEDPAARDARGRAPLIIQGHDHGPTDQIGWLLPAVPTEDLTTFWGYTSVPLPGVDWWRALPTRKAA